MNDAPLCNQDGWDGWCHWQVLVPYENEGVAYNGTKAVRTNTGGTYVYKTIQPTSKALVSVAINVHNAGELHFSIKNDDTTLGEFDVTNYYAGLRVLNNDTFERVFDIANDVWYLVQIETDSPNGRYRLKLDQGQWTDWKAFSNNNPAQLNKIEFSYIKPNWFSDYVYFDAVSISEVNN